MSRRKTPPSGPPAQQTLDLFDAMPAQAEPTSAESPVAVAPAPSPAPVTAVAAHQPVTSTETALPELSEHERLAADLAHWVAQGWLRELDCSFALFLQTLDPDASPALLLAAALASYQLGRGHVCLDLQAVLSPQRAGLALPSEAANSSNNTGSTGAHRPPEHWLRTLRFDSWCDALRGSPVCGDGPGSTPLVLQGSRLYLRRYWQYEGDVRASIATRLQPAPVAPAERVRPVLDLLFGAAENDAAPDWQKMACALALRQHFAIVTGGPGTGKTTTVVRLLALLQSLAWEDARGDTSRLLRIQLAAPTGKAAARLTESIRGALNKLPWPALPGGEALRLQVPSAATTLHRLLGSRPDSRRLRHHAGNPLALDVLVVDEASMVDLEMMTALLQALPATARLVLLGDKDQLASVEAGAALGELCRRAEAGHYDDATVQWLSASTGHAPEPALRDPQGQPLDQAIAMLRVSHRFTADSGIGQLAFAVNAGDAVSARRLWQRGLPDLRQVTLNAAPSALGQDAALRRLILADDGTAADGSAQPVGPAYYLRRMLETQPAPDALRPAWDVWASKLLEDMARFQLLCALREGPWGVSGLSTVVAELLREAGWLQGTQGWFAGRPVLVTRNDHALGLMNGDVGLVLELPARFDDTTGRPDAEAGTARRVAFPSGDGSGGVRWVLPARLQAVETVFAMTVHKSQGSEFAHTAFVLPDTINPVLTRELVYTGITRAKQWFTLVAPAQGGARVMDEAIERRVVRASGLVANA